MPPLIGVFACHCEPVRRLVWQSRNFLDIPFNRGIPTPVVLRAANQNELLAGGKRTLILCALARNDCDEVYFYGRKQARLL